MNVAHLYVIGEAQEPNGYVKVGLHYGNASASGRPGLSTGNWRKLVVLHHHAVPEDIARWTEYVIHRHLQPWHVRGEWFDLRPLLAGADDWSRLLKRATHQQVPGGVKFVVGTAAHRLQIVRLINRQPPKVFSAECSCGESLLSTATTLAAVVKRFDHEHAAPVAQSDNR